jgi:hypothetical protein
MRNLMLKTYAALSIVSPAGERIAQGIKTLEIRTWQPPEWPLKDLLIVENDQYLNHDGDESIGRAVALVDVMDVHPWREDEFEAACASYWAKGYFAWVLDNVRPIQWQLVVPAKRKIYRLNLELQL